MNAAIARAKSSFVNNSFLASTATLASGTLFSQVILFAASPVLSRIFTLADFGNLANYNAWVSVLALFGNLRYEHAILVARGTERTARAVALAIALTVVSVAVYSIFAVAIMVLYSGGGYLGTIRGIVAFIPVGALAVCVSSLFGQYGTKRGTFRRLAVIAAVQSVCTIVPQLVLGLAHVPNAMIIGSIIGYSTSAALLAQLFFQAHPVAVFRPMFRLRALREVAHEFANFPRYTLWADAISVAVQQFVPVFVLALFNPAIAGMYAFSTRVIRVPAVVVSTAVSQVLRKKAVDVVHGGYRLTSLFSVMLRGLVGVALIPFTVLALFGRPIFGLVFGHQWVEAGSLVQILSPALFFEFVAVPLSVFFLVTNTQHYTLRVQAMGLVGLVGGLAFGRRYLHDFSATCYVVAGVMIAINLTAILLAARVARRTPALESAVVSMPQAKVSL